MSWCKCNKCNGVFATPTNLKIHQNHCSGGEKMELKLEEIPKCELGHCEHPPEDHNGGTCWHIVKEDLKDKQTNDKYCPCKMSDESIKSWSAIEAYEGKGWMEPDKCQKCNGEGFIVVCIDPKTKQGKKKECSSCDGRGTSDIMVTKECEVCKKILLLRTDTERCVKCQPLYINKAL